MQFQQKKRGKKKKKPATSKLVKSDSVEDSKQQEHGDCSSATSEVDTVSIASVDTDTDKDVSYIASGAHCKAIIPEQVSINKILEHA